MTMDTPNEPELVVDGGRPIPEQLEGQIRRQIVDGVLRPGDELPTVREVAVGLSVNPHAVEQAYGRLEQHGFLLAGDGCGPRVAGVPGQTTRRELSDLCQEFVQRVSAEGYSMAEALQVLYAWIDRGASHGQSS
jgi:GntR family transcriptional regulator